MNFTLSASRLMKAKDVKNLCKEMRENKQALVQHETMVKATMYRRLSSKKVKVAS